MLKCHWELFLEEEWGKTTPVVCEALRCLCSVPAQLPEPEQDLSPAPVTFVNENMAKPEFGQDKMLFLRVGDKKKKNKIKKSGLMEKGNQSRGEKYIKRFKKQNRIWKGQSTNAKSHRRKGSCRGRMRRAGREGTGRGGKQLLEWHRGLES